MFLLMIGNLATKESIGDQFYTREAADNTEGSESRQAPEISLIQLFPALSSTVNPSESTKDSPIPSVAPEVEASEKDSFNKNSLYGLFGLLLLVPLLVILVHRERISRQGATESSTDHSHEGGDKDTFDDEEFGKNSVEARNSDNHNSEDKNDLEDDEEEQRISDDEASRTDDSEKEWANEAMEKQKSSRHDNEDAI
jgi:hypothetical protein